MRQQQPIAKHSSQALEDGMITSDEAAMLNTLRKNLGISDSRHASLLAELLDRDEQSEDA